MTRVDFVKDRRRRRHCRLTQYFWELSFIKYAIQKAETLVTGQSWCNEAT